MTGPGKKAPPPEVDLLLSAVGRVVHAPSAAEGSAARDVLDPAPRSIDPERLRTLAVRHSLETQTFHGLSGLVEQGHRELEGVRDALKEPALLGAAGNLRRLRETERVHDLLESRGIQVLAMKGAALALQAYGDPHLRAYGDVDLLIRPEDASAALELLGKQGYTGWGRGRAGAPSPERWHEWGFTAPDGHTLVEVHWHLSSPLRFPGLDGEEAWVRPARVTVEGRSYRTLRPEVLVPYLAVHGTAHSWAELEFPASIAGVLVRHPGADWGEMMEVATRWRVRRLSLVGLALAERLFQAPLPPVVTRSIRDDPEVRRAAAWFAGKLIHDPGTWYHGSPRLLWRHFRLRDTLPEQLRAGWSMLLGPTPAEWREGEGTVATRLGGRSLRRVARLLRRYLGRSPSR